MGGRSKDQNVLILANVMNHVCRAVFNLPTSHIYDAKLITQPQELSKLANFVHIISESSTSMDPNIADIVHKHLWEII